jgi:hypothetical protein
MLNQMMKNMKATKYILRWRTAISMVIVGTVLYSCTDGFDDLNKNPNDPSEENVKPSFLLTGVFNQSILDPGMHERITQLTNDVFAQYYANEGFSTQKGITNDEWITDFYNNYHNSMVTSLNLAIRIGDKSETKYNETQIARIWRAWVYARATDIWGDIPYFKAADGTGTNPPYDSQELIYKDLLKELQEASDLLSTENPSQLPGQDYVYGDNIDKWKKFANSLRLRLAIRISEVEPALSKQHAEDAIAKGVFTSSDESCIVPRGPGFGWGYDYQYTYYYGWGAESMSRSMENLLTGLGGQDFPNPPPGFDAPIALVYDDPGVALTPGDENTIDPNANKFKLGVPSKVDPRGPVYFNVTSEGSGASDNIVVNGNTVDTRYRWHGVPAGLSTGAAGKTQYSVFNTARLGEDFAKNGSRGYEVLTYHEVCFLLAEAAFRGYNVGGGTAQAWYEKGITASMKWHGIDDATIAAYIVSTAQNTYGTTVLYTNDSGKTFLGNSVDDQLEKIITQKYIALFPDGGWEAWADHRRLHLPVLVPFAGGLDPKYTVRDGGPDNFTKRITYPAIEALNNETLYNEAVGRQGADKETTNLWWDKD